MTCIAIKASRIIVTIALLGMSYFKLKRFFTPRLNLRPGSSVRLEEDEALHIRQSLRLKAGDEIILFNGAAEFTARLGLVTKEVVMANILEKISDTEENSTFKLSLAQSLIKLSNFELVLEKCSELGITEFIPLAAEFSQVSSKTIQTKRPRFEKIILSACKQSERNFVPTLLEPVKLTQELIQQWKAEYDLVLVATLKRQATAQQPVLSAMELPQRLADTESTLLVIGPEGGFSPSEHKLLTAEDIALVEFVNGNILRSETAAIACAAILIQLKG
jgi:16S rRNA (uracil1498-N3)-methyltransferase